jgi:hypothetical protein
MYLWIKATAEFGHTASRNKARRNERVKVVPLPFDRLTPTVLLVLQESVGLFRSAGGLVLLSGGKLGPQISRRSCHVCFPDPPVYTDRYIHKRIWRVMINLHPLVVVGRYRWLY